MRKSFVFTLAALIAFVGCSKKVAEPEQVVEPETPVVEIPQEEAKLVTIKAVIDNENEDETKTSYEENTSTMKADVSWVAGDKISILYSNGGYDYEQKEFTTTLGDGTFTGTPGTTEGGQVAYWAIYPYNICDDLYPDGTTSEVTRLNLPTSYTGSGEAGIPMNAHTLKANWDGTYHLKHMGAILRFKFTNIPSSAKKLVISNDSKDLAGRYYTTYDSTNDLIYYTTGTGDDGAQRSVTYSFTPGLDNTYTFYLPFGCTTPSGNFTFTFKNDKDEDICTRTTTLGSLASTTLVRNTMYRININVMSFDNYPLSSITIAPTSLPTSATSLTKFTISSFDFYSYYTVNESGTTIKFSGDGGGSERIYNSTSLGTIAKIVVTNSGESKYYRDNYIMYAGTSADPAETEINYSATTGSGANQTSTTYVFTASATPYTHFCLKNKQTWSDRVVGSITIYYKPAE